MQTEAGPDFLALDGNPDLRITTPVSVATYDDHRMAMAFAMLAARLDGIAIEHPQVVNKSFPTYWTVLQRLGITLRPHDAEAR